MFTACHPVLPTEGRVALTLRLLGGLTTDEIARAFLVPEPTVAQRIVRAKRTLAQKRVPFEVPAAEDRGSRLASMLEVIYLIFNEGYTASSGAELHRTELSTEAIRLARAVHTLLPDNGEVAGLLALMLLTDARRAARVGPRGELIPLDEQDRTLWDRRAIAEGVALASAALCGDRWASIKCRRRLPPYTMRRSAPRPPTGRRSARCTAS
jgi:predicted RNA polymerase sigma factor